MSYKKSDGSITKKSMDDKHAPLDIERIKRANQILDEFHPLSQAPLYEVLPFLKPLIKRCCLKKAPAVEQQEEDFAAQRRVFTMSLSEPLQPKSSKKVRLSIGEYIMEKLRIVYSQRKNQKNFDDPFIEYGFGVVAFFQIMKMLIFIFTILSVLSIYPIVTNWTSNGQELEFAHKLSSTTLGHTGASFSNCFVAPLALDKIVLGCNGTAKIAEVFGGLVPASHDGINYEDKKICMFKNSVPDVCSDFVDTRLNDTLVAQCLNSSQCEVSNIMSTIISKTGTNQSCIGTNSYIFAQVKCYQDEEDMSSKRLVGLICVCIGIFSCLLYVAMLYYQDQVNELDFAVWDMKTVETNDFSAEVKISEHLWTKYLNYCRDHQLSDDYRSENLTQFIQNYIETALRAYAYESDSQDLLIDDKLQIAMIEFDFKQYGLIDLFRQRGDKIKELKFSDKREVEAKINKYLLTNNQHLVRPLTAFVTFEYTSGYNLFMSMVQSRLNTENAKELQVKQAPIPSNIIWEYRNITRYEKFKKQAFSYLIMGLFLIIGIPGALFFRWQGETQMSPLKKITCDTAYSQFGTSLPYYAEKSYNHSIDYFDQFLISKIDQYDMDLISCYCFQYFPKPIYKFDQQVLGYDLDDATYNQTYHQQMCDTYENNYIEATLSNYAIMKSVVLVNFLLRIFVIFVLKIIGYETSSRQAYKIMIFVFLIQFFNTGPLVIVVNAYISHSGLELLNWLKAGIHPDFSDRWYLDVGGTIINTMIFNIFWPIIEFALFYSIRLARRLWDRNFIHSSWSTKQQTIQQYVGIYQGPIYQIHYKYSFILNIVFITFMFGAGIPLLFPIALCSFIVFYITERLQLAYSYRKPPMFDETLSEQSIRLMMYAPLLYLTVGFWMFNNIQLFYNKTEPTHFMNDGVNTGHTIYSAFRMDHSTPLILMFGLLLVILGLKAYVTRFIQRWLNIDIAKFKIKYEQISFYEALNKYQRRWILKEDEASRKKFGIKKLSDQTIQKLQKTPLLGEAELIGVMTYNILDNPVYQEQFQYVPEILENREKYIIDDWMANAIQQSDYVKKKISTFYLPSENQSIRVRIEE